jgi:hypothetical protein
VKRFTGGLHCPIDRQAGISDRKLLGHVNGLILGSTTRWLHQSAGRVRMIILQISDAKNDAQTLLNQRMKTIGAGSTTVL